MRIDQFLAAPQPACFGGMVQCMTENVIPFPAHKPAPILIRRWRTIVDVNGTHYALDVTASYSLFGAGARHRSASATGSQGRGAAAAPPSTQTLRLAWLLLGDDPDIQWRVGVKNPRAFRARLRGVRARGRWHCFS